MALSDNIRRLRTEKGLTASALADIVGTDRQTIYKYERDLCKPQPEMFVQIARALGTTCEDLLDGDSRD